MMKLLFFLLLLLSFFFDGFAQSSYTVKKGDTLYRIATQNDVTVEAIKSLNKLTDNTVAVGQVLLIPDSPSTQTNTKEEESNRSSTTYIVKKGDSLYGIARKFSVTVDFIMKQNNLEDYSIAIGQELIVSSGERRTPLRTSSFIPPSLTKETLTKKMSLTEFAYSVQMEPEEVVLLNPSYTLSDVLPAQTSLYILQPTTRRGVRTYIRTTAEKKSVSVVEVQDEGNPFSTEFSPTFLFPNEKQTVFSSGEMYNPNELVVAHFDLPLGSVVSVHNASTGLTCIAQVKERSSDQAVIISDAVAKHLNFDTRSQHQVKIEKVTF